MASTSPKVRSRGWSPSRRNAFRPERSWRSATFWTAHQTTCSNRSLKCAPQRQPMPRNAAKTSESNQATRSHDGSVSSLRRMVSRPRKAEDPIRWQVPATAAASTTKPSRAGRTAESAAIAISRQNAPVESVPAATTVSCRELLMSGRHSGDARAFGSISPARAAAPKANSISAHGAGPAYSATS